MYIIHETGWSYEYVTHFTSQDINYFAGALNLLNDPEAMKKRSNRVKYTDKSALLSKLGEYSGGVSIK